MSLHITRDPPREMKTYAATRIISSLKLQLRSFVSILIHSTHHHRHPSIHPSIIFLLLLLLLQTSTYQNPSNFSTLIY